MFSLGLSFSIKSKVSSRSFSRLSMSIDQFDALLFDCDGVIAETERDVHRISFNEAFKAKGISDSWDVDKYGELLRIGGNFLDLYSKVVASIYSINLKSTHIKVVKRE